ncbi:hypothetical protein [Hathewaya massiliensis]|uniref:hypothetical protein n=1 Tax=Hathewaya massiliensis TaxID=1964382 RepID=UPI001159833A|nr:hypothetical protein [Hathewaya massiliensis]
MQERVHDFFTCFKISLKVSLIPIVIGSLIGIIYGLVKGGLNYVLVFRWIYAMAIYASCLGLFVCAIAFMKPKYMGQLNHQKEWDKHFYKFGLIKVIGYVSAMVLIYAVILDYILYLMR